jgi:hypothetical protein
MFFSGEKEIETTLFLGLITVGRPPSLVLFQLSKSQINRDRSTGEASIYPEK